MIQELATVIQTAADPVHLEELLRINDELISLLAQLPGPVRPALTLQGLGLTWDDANSSPSDLGKTLYASTNGGGFINGQAMHGNSTGYHTGEEDEDPQPTTPKIDKGKGKAEPEPEEPEKVLSPAFLITESEDEDEDGHRFPSEEGEEGDDRVSPSPTDRYVCMLLLVTFVEDRQQIEDMGGGGRRSFPQGHPTSKAGRFRRGLRR